MVYNLQLILGAYLLDLIFGDPQWMWHPVRLIGRLIEKLERKLNTDSINRRFAGGVLLILVIAITVFSVFCILKLARLIHPVLYYGLSVISVYFALSVKSLATEANKVYRALENEDLPQARRDLSMIVARDTDKLEEPEIIRATVETVAESIMDGIIAPLFYMASGGLMALWAYKAINTLDSMVGYRSERYLDFGMASARLDGWVNFIPAKITCFFISAASIFCGKDCLRSLKWAKRYFFKGGRENSDATESAMAGALKVQLGGLNFYNSIAINKPLLGDRINPLNTEHIKESLRIAYISSALFVAICIILSGLLW